VITDEVWGMGGEGKPTEWRNYRFPFRDSEGREYVAAFLVDVTLDKEAEKKIRQYRDGMEEVNKQLRRLASTDGLTGLRNRRAFDSTLQQEYEVARRYGHPLSLLVIDIDHFKHFNDSFGHEEGDRVLRRVAGAMESTFRGADFVARYGGEEFSVILPNTVRVSAVESAERLRATIAGLAEEREPITVSIGVACLQGQGWTTAELLKQADSALYRAKREGRDRICVG
jgi:diguanylate cyclase (GGDEF)-like protein